MIEHGRGDLAAMSMQGFFNRQGLAELFTLSIFGMIAIEFVAAAVNGHAGRRRRIYQKGV